MRAALLVLLSAPLFAPQPSELPAGGPERAAATTSVRLAGLSESVPKLFLSLINDAIMGKIAARVVRYEAPSSVFLEGGSLYDPEGELVAQVARARATVSLSALLSGEVQVTQVELVDPVLKLELHGEGDHRTLNLIEAFTPKKKPTGEAEGIVKLDLIDVKNGEFSFTDNHYVTVTAGGIDGRGSVDVDVGRKMVLVDWRDPRVARGMVKLEQLDVPISDVRADQVRVLTERVEVKGVRGTAAGAKVSAVSGSVNVKGDGMLSFSGTIDAPPSSWPERLKPLPFAKPAVQATVDVLGPFADPHVKVDGRFGVAELYGYRLDSGRGVVDVNKDRALLKEGTAAKIGGGNVKVTGTVALPSLELDLLARAADVATAAALAPAKLDPPPKGTVSASARLTGKADGEAAIVVDGTLSGRRVELAQVKLPVDVTGSARVSVTPKLATIARASLQAGTPELEAYVSGEVDLERERLRLSGSAVVDDATRLVPAVPADVSATRARWQGTIAGPYRDVHVDGDVEIERGSAYGALLEQLKAHVEASPDEAWVKGLSGRAAGGSVAQLEPLHVVYGEASKAGRGKPKLLDTITGAFRVDGADLSTIESTAKPAQPGAARAKLPLAGRATVTATLRGAYDDPTVALVADGTAVAVSGELLDVVHAQGSATRRGLLLDDVRVHGKLIDATAARYRLSFEGEGPPTLDGDVQVARLDLAEIAASKSAQLRGLVQGAVRTRGAATAPSLFGRLSARGLMLGKRPFGDGPLVVTLGPDGASRVPDALVAGVSLALNADAYGAWEGQVSYAIERGIINGRLSFHDVDLLPFTQDLGGALSPLEGYINGAVEVRGPLERLSGRVKLRVPELAVNAAAAAAGAVEDAAAAIPILRPLGGMFVDVQMTDGDVDARVCAFPLPEEAEPGSPCPGGERLWASAKGHVDVRAATYALDVEARATEDRIEDLVPALRQQEFAVGASARVSVHAARTSTGKTDAQGAALYRTEVRGDGTLLEASVAPPGALLARLQRPAHITYRDGRFTLDAPARFVAAGADGAGADAAGAIDLSFAGSAGTEDIALDVNGTAALSIAKLFTPEISYADGTAATELTLRGRYDEGVRIAGTLVPAKGASITPRVLGEPVVFSSGSFALAPRTDDARTLTITARDVKASVGDGALSARGSFDVRTAREGDEPWIPRWDLDATATALSLKTSAGRMELSADLSLDGTPDDTVLRGRAEITDGSFKKAFELKNFVLSAAPTKKSEPIYETLAPAGLGNLSFDVDLTMQNVRTRANIGTLFNADLSLRGAMHLRQTLRMPIVDGAIEVEEGTLHFKRATFDVTEMQMELPTAPDGSINPVVHMTARAELPPGAAGTNDTELPIDLLLDGSLQEGLQVDLTAIDPQRQWTKTELFALVVFGSVPGQGINTASSEFVVNALVSELSAPVDAEVERAIAENLGVNVEVDLLTGGFRWQLGRRLQLEAQGLFIGQQASTNTVTSSPASTDGWHGRLLLRDHYLVLIKDIAIDGRATNSGLVDVRLALRLFED